MRFGFALTLLALLPMMGFAEAGSEHYKGDGRYVLLERELPTKEKLILKLDSETGKTWRLSTSEGQPLWVPIPEAGVAKPAKEKTDLDRAITIYPK